MKKKVNLTIIIEKDEDGLFVASVPALRGCFTQAKTYEELIPRIKEAVALYLEDESSDIFQNTFVSVQQMEFSL
ncbi:MAG TPA: type II toxin-antitoxin system HicB family antitoxin [Caldisericia bacterium]|nr:type II toxin-antitoxin system HicB family antitoxin [Caldisericia bacterium]